MQRGEVNRHPFDTENLETAAAAGSPLNAQGVKKYIRIYI